MSRPAATEDVVDAMIAQDMAADVAKAKYRGERVHLLTARIVNALHASGMLRGEQTAAHVEIARVVVDDLYGNCAVDLRGLDQ